MDRCNKSNTTMVIAVLEGDSRCGVKMECPTMNDYEDIGEVKRDSDGLVRVVVNYGRMRSRC